MNRVRDCPELMMTIGEFLPSARPMCRSCDTDAKQHDSLQVFEDISGGQYIAPPMIDMCARCIVNDKVGQIVTRIHQKYEAYNTIHSDSYHPPRRIVDELGYSLEETLITAYKVSTQHSQLQLQYHTCCGGKGIMIYEHDNERMSILEDF